jgi:hypothetical protein
MDIANTRGLRRLAMTGLQQGFVTSGMAFRYDIAEQQSHATNVAYGSRATDLQWSLDVRFALL